jgi:hypothetical protein
MFLEINPAFCRRAFQDTQGSDFQQSMLSRDAPPLPLIDQNRLYAAFYRQRNRFAFTGVEPKRVINVLG